MSPINKIAIIASLLGVIGTAHASPTITALSVNPRAVDAGKPVIFSIHGQELENAICALRINYGDGSSAVRQMDWGKNKRFPLQIRKTYNKPGKYSVRVSGIKYGNYLRCMGSARVMLTVAVAKP